MMQKKLQDKIGTKQFDDFNAFKTLVTKTIKDLKLKLDAKEQKIILNAVCWKNEDAEKVIKKLESNGTVIYEPNAQVYHISILYQKVSCLQNHLNL